MKMMLSDSLVVGLPIVCLDVSLSTLRLWWNTTCGVSLYIHVYLCCAVLEAGCLVICTYPGHAIACVL